MSYSTHATAGTPGSGSTEKLNDAEVTLPSSYHGSFSRGCRYGYEYDKHVKSMSSRFNEEYERRRDHDKKIEECRTSVSYDGIRVEACEFFARDNALEHHTEMYEIVKNDPARPVYRRGLSFMMEVKFEDRKFDPEHDHVRLVFNFGPNPTVPKDTKIVIPLTAAKGKEKKDKINQWDARIKSIDGKSAQIEVCIPADAPVGVWKCWIETSPDAFNQEKLDRSPASRDVSPRKQESKREEKDQYRRRGGRSRETSPSRREGRSESPSRGQDYRKERYFQDKHSESPKTEGLFRSKSYHPGDREERETPRMNRSSSYRDARGTSPSERNRFRDGTSPSARDRRRRDSPYRSDRYRQGTSPSEREEFEKNREYRRRDREGQSEEDYYLKSGSPYRRDRYGYSEHESRRPYRRNEEEGSSPYRRNDYPDGRMEEGNRYRNYNSSYRMGPSRYGGSPYRDIPPFTMRSDRRGRSPYNRSNYPERYGPFRRGEYRQGGSPYSEDTYQYGRTSPYGMSPFRSEPGSLPYRHSSYDYAMEMRHPGRGSYQRSGSYRNEGSPFRREDAEKTLYRSQSEGGILRERRRNTDAARGPYRRLGDYRRDGSPYRREGESDRDESPGDRDYRRESGRYRVDRNQRDNSGEDYRREGYGRGYRSEPRRDYSERRDGDYEKDQSGYRRSGSGRDEDRRKGRYGNYGRDDSGSRQDRDFDRFRSGEREGRSDYRQSGSTDRREYYREGGTRGDSSDNLRDGSRQRMDGRDRSGHRRDSSGYRKDGNGNYMDRSGTRRNGRGYGMNRNDYRRDGSYYRRDGSGYSRDGSGHNRDGSGYRRDGSEYSRNGSGYRRNGSGYRRDGSGYSRDGSGYRRDGSGYSRNGSGHRGDGSSYRRDGSEYSRDNSGYRRDDSGYRREGRGYRRDGSGYSRDGSGYRRDDSGSRRDGSEHRRDGRGYRRDGSDYRGEGSRYRRDGSGYRRNGSEYRRDGSDSRRADSEHRRDSSGYRRYESDYRRDGSIYRRDGSRFNRDGSDYRRDGSDYRRDGSEHREDNRKYRRDGSDYRREEVDYRNDRTSHRNDNDKRRDGSNYSRDHSDYRRNSRDSSDYRKNRRDSSDYRKDRRDDSDYRKDRRDGSDYRKDRRDSSDYRKDRRDDSAYRKDRRDGSDYRKDCRDGSDYRKDRTDDNDYRKDRRDGSDYRKDRRDGSDYRKNRRDGSDYRKDRRDSSGYRRDRGDYDQNDRDGSDYRRDRRDGSDYRRERRDGSSNRRDGRDSHRYERQSCDGRRDGKRNYQRDGSFNRDESRERGHSAYRRGGDYLRDGSPYQRGDDYEKEGSSYQRRGDYLRDGSPYDRDSYRPSEYKRDEGRSKRRDYDRDECTDDLRDRYGDKRPYYEDRYGEKRAYYGDRYAKSGYGNKSGQYDSRKRRGQVFKCKQDIYILFNPWCKEDSTYMENDMRRNEYVLNDVGKIWIGTYGRNKGRSWVYGQFDDVVLPAVMYLLEEARMGATERGNPVRVVRAISEMVNNKDYNNGLMERKVNSQPENSVMMGRWDGNYDDGVSPYSWTGSVKILEQYLRTGKPVKYGQCWVFSAVTTTICRSLGIPCRSVTNFVSAHDTNNSLCIDKYFSCTGDEIEGGPDGDSWDSVWNFHSWNDVWMARPDLPSGYGGWQAIDSTFQEESDGRYKCGPASLESIRRGEIGFCYDTPFVYSEVNAEVNHWQEDEESEWGFTRMRNGNYHVGRQILTKRHDHDDDDGDNDVEDVLREYRPKDGFNKERHNVMCALHGVERGYLSKNTSYQYKGKDDVLFELVEVDRVQIGQPFTVAMNMTNKSGDTRNVQAMLSCHSVYYTGVKNRRIKQHNGHFVLKPNQRETMVFKVMPDEYQDKMVDYAMIKIYAVANVRETKQAWGEEDDFYFEKPRLGIQTRGSNRTNEDMEINFSFTNPLNLTLTNCKFSLEAPGMRKPKIAKFRDVRPGEMVNFTDKCIPKNSGNTKIVGNFSSHQLNEVTGCKSICIRE